jgi:hypothetical protein
MSDIKFLINIDRIPIKIRIMIKNSPICLIFLFVICLIYERLLISVLHLLAIKIINDVLLLKWYSENSNFYETVN